MLQILSGSNASTDVYLREGQGRVSGKARFDKFCRERKERNVRNFVIKQMDSGGPVLWQNPTTKRFVVVGIISMGIGCGDTGGVNTRVGAYIDWIVSETAGSNASYRIYLCIYIYAACKWKTFVLDFYSRFYVLHHRIKTVRSFRLDSTRTDS